MRFDILDEYSTLVPFGRGMSKHNRVIHYPTDPAKAVKRGAIANCASRLKLVLKFVAVLRHVGGREDFGRYDDRMPRSFRHAPDCRRLPL